MRPIASIVGAAWSIAASACGGGVPPALTPAGVAAAAQRWPDSSEAMLGQGHDLFVAKCNRCHAYPDVRSLSDEEWAPVVERMGNRAKLSAEEKTGVLRFVLTTRGQ